MKREGEEDFRVGDENFGHAGNRRFFGNFLIVCISLSKEIEIRNF